MPFWRYVAIDGRGWGRVVDHERGHPGCFNLIWLSSGVQLPPQDYLELANDIRWAMTEPQHIPMGRLTMADWAYRLDLASFLEACQQHKAQLAGWRFIEPSMNFKKLFKLVQQHLRA
jgi:hypothetical protein